MSLRILATLLRTGPRTSTTPRQTNDATPTRSEQEIQNMYAVMKESSDDSSSCENDEVTDSEAESEENEGLSIDQDLEGYRLILDKVSFVLSFQILVTDFTENRHVFMLCTP